MDPYTTPAPFDSLSSGPLPSGPFLSDSLPFGPFPFARFRRLRFGDHRPPCPHCGGTHIQRWGSFSGRRRYRCVGCGRTFSDLTGTPLAFLKHLDRWPAFCHCMLASRSVRDAARRLGVDKTTAFRWRHRLLAVLEASDTTPLGASVLIHETWFPLSEKGRRGLDRPPRRRAAFRRIDMTPVWVFVARDETGRLASGVVGTHRPRAQDLETALRARLTATTEIVSSIGPYGAAGLLAVRGSLAYRRTSRREPEMAALHRSIRALRRWLRRFRGVATRYLDHYLAWHRLLEACRGGDRAGAPPAPEPYATGLQPPECDTPGPRSTVGLPGLTGVTGLPGLPALLAARMP